MTSDKQVKKYIFRITNTALGREGQSIRKQQRQVALEAIFIERTLSLAKKPSKTANP
jgi:hypothetical protein